MTRVPVLEIGGTHVTAALVDTAPGGQEVSGVVRRPLRADATADVILDAVAAAARCLDVPEGAHWGVAVPGPFDYQAGIGRFEGIGKFESLRGVDVGAGLRERLRPRPASISFLNDADAFGVGEYLAGAAAGHERAVCITLGTGVGSSFLLDGTPVADGPDVPPEGRAHRISIDGLPLEEIVSRRAIRVYYAEQSATGGEGGVPDVRDITALARAGDPYAYRTVRHCFGQLGRALAPWCARFRPGVLVVGGSMAGSWDLVGPALRAGLEAESGGGGHVPLSTAARPADAPLIGAASRALDHTVGPSRSRT